MCLMCNALLKELAEEHLEERAFSGALANLLRNTRLDMGLSATPLPKPELEDPCIECERREADADAFGFFCSKECMDDYDGRVRRELREESGRLRAPLKKSVWDGEHARPTLDEVMRREFEKVPSHLRV